MKSWDDLPMAHTVEVYVVYRTPLLQQMLTMHSENQDTCELIQSVVHMEQYGPVHVSID